MLCYHTLITAVFKIMDYYGLFKIMDYSKKIPEEGESDVGSYCRVKVMEWSVRSEVSVYLSKREEKKRRKVEIKITSNTEYK